MPVVRFWRDYGARTVGPGTTLMAAAQRAGVPLGNACRSQGVCRACAVLVLEGADQLDPPNQLEAHFGLESGWRMACQARVANHATAIAIWTPAWAGDPSER